MTLRNTTSSVFDINAYVPKDWYRGYKLEVDITVNSTAEDWTLNFDLPYDVRDAYGVDLVDNGNDSYSIKGKSGKEDLEKGKTIKAILIVDHNKQNTIVPEFTLQGSKISTSAETEKATEAPSSKNSNAIEVGFENHSNDTKYKTAVQEKDWGNVSWSNRMYKYGTISDKYAHSGDKSLQITYPSDAQSNTAAAWRIPEQKEYYLSYWVKFDENFDFNGSELSGGKLPGMGADNLCSGGSPCTGTNGFSSRHMWREDGEAVLYLYHMDKPNKYGENIEFEGSDGSSKYFEPGKWHNIIQRVKMNDANQSNGELDVWMDKEQVLDIDNLKLVTNNHGVDTVYFSSFHGGDGSKWWPENDVYAYFDDFVVSTNAADVGL